MGDETRNLDPPVIIIGILPGGLPLCYCFLLSMPRRVRGSDGSLPMFLDFANARVDRFWSSWLISKPEPGSAVKEDQKGAKKTKS